MRVPRARFVHRQRSALECLIAEAADGFLGVGPGAELHEGEPARLASVAVRGQREVQERTNGGEVRTQLRLSHVIREVANKQAYSHYGLLLGEEGVDAPHPRRVAVSIPVRSCHADSRLREHGVPGERSYPPRIRAASGSESVVIQMDEALCYSAYTWWCAVGRSSRVLETP